MRDKGDGESRVCCTLACGLAMACATGGLRSGTDPELAARGHCGLPERAEMTFSRQCGVDFKEANKMVGFCLIC